MTQYTNEVHSKYTQKRHPRCKTTMLSLLTCLVFVLAGLSFAEAHRIPHFTHHSRYAHKHSARSVRKHVVKQTIVVKAGEVYDCRGETYDRGESCNSPSETSKGEAVFSVMPVRNTTDVLSLQLTRSRAVHYRTVSLVSRSCPMCPRSLFNYCRCGSKTRSTLRIWQLYFHQHVNMSWCSSCLCVLRR